MKLARRFSQLVLVLVLGFTVVAGVSIYSVRSEANELRSALIDIQVYVKEESLPALQSLSASPVVQGENRKAVTELITLFTDQPSTSDLQHDVEKFGTSLRALRTFLVQVAGNESIALLPSFTQLKTISYGKGETMAKLYYAYNQKVLLWNERDRSGPGRLVASALRLESLLMVNPDGSTELTPTISFE